MNGTLQYSLGLATGGFLGNLQAVQGRVAQFSGFMGKLPVIGASLAGLLGGVSSIHAVIENAMHQIEKGAALNDLSKRTGESVGALYTLQRGFSVVGVAAESVAPALMTMQKALGGFSEFGEPTKNIFAGIGLSIEDLKAQDGPAALNSIVRALAKLRNDEAATAAFKIFGRSMGADMLQVARSADEFGNAMAGANAQAGMFQRNAAEFEAVDKGLAKLKMRFNGLFLGMAEGMAPGLNGILQSLNKIDLTPLGQRVGEALTGFTQAFREGKITTVVALGLQAGFETALTYLGKGLIGIGLALKETMAAIFSEDSLSFWQNRFRRVGAEGRAEWENTEAQRAMERMKSATSPQEKDAARASMRSHLDAAQQYSGYGLEYQNRSQAASDQMEKVFALAMAQSMKNAVGFSMGTGAAEQFSAALADLAARAPHATENAAGGNERLAGAPPKPEKLRETKPEASNTWANLGFILGQGGAGGHQERIAQNTLRTANLIQKLVDRTPKPTAQQNFLQRATSPNTTFD